MHTLPAYPLFVASLATRPYCTDSPADGVYRAPLPDALTRRLIGPNTHKRVTMLVFDVDRPGAAIDWHDRGAPAPTWSVKNPANGHAHLIYLLAAPVAVSEAASRKAVSYLAAIQEGMRRRLDADRGYSGVLVKNPVNPHWQVQEWHGEPYTLDELADYVDLPTPQDMRRMVEREDYAGLGRNCELFERLRLWAYRAVRDYWRPNGEPAFRNAARAQAEAINTLFSNPLGPREVLAVARSVAKWTYANLSPVEFRRVQKARATRTGKAKRDEHMATAKRMAAECYSLREIAETCGVSKQTVSNWLARA